MRLATVRRAGGTTAAMQQGDDFVLIDDYTHAGGVLAAGEAGAAAAHAAMSSGASITGNVELDCPVLAAPAIFCVGLNYRTHIQEMGRELPTHPTLFSKLPRALIGPTDAIPLPSASRQLDYEGELVAVIGRGGRNIPVRRALEHVAGITLMNDVTVRDYQWRTSQWLAGKTWERSTPVGPAIVSLDELPPLSELDLRVTVNGETRQEASIDDLVFDVPTLVSDVSTIVELRPGDMIATGTPGGVGAASDPQRFLAEGDVVVVEIDGIGRLENRVTASAVEGAQLVGASS